MAALPPSMLNMGWEYPAQLLQGPDPLPATRHRAARDDASQQPNHAVRFIILPVGCTCSIKAL